jgi:hypothetical protein
MCTRVGPSIDPDGEEFSPLWAYRRRLEVSHLASCGQVHVSRWSGRWKPLVLVTSRTVVNWHHAGFRLYWA